MEAAHLNLLIRQKENLFEVGLKIFWLSYVDEENRMYCKLCRESTSSDSSSVFVSGSQNFKIESVRSHESSTGHTRLVAAAKVAENPQLAPLPRSLLSLSTEVMRKME